MLFGCDFVAAARCKGGSFRRGDLDRDWRSLVGPPPTCVEHLSDGLGWAKPKLHFTCRAGEDEMDLYELWHLGMAKRTTTSYPTALAVGVRSIVPPVHARSPRVAVSRRYDPARFASLV